ncbi:MAG: hypothetical protein AAFU61_08740, partial [Pseudomonadota bacterium]
PRARIGGDLMLTTREAPDLAGRVAGVATLEVEEEGAPDRPSSWRVALGVTGGLLFGTLAVLAAQATAFAAAPRFSDEAAFDMAERPFRMAGLGLLTLAALVGAVPVLAATVVGLPVAALALAAVPLALLTGYALGAWGLGAAIWRAMDRPAPGGLGARLLIGLIGLATLSLLGLIPFLGWLLATAATFAGLGVILSRSLGGGDAEASPA